VSPSPFGLEPSKAKPSKERGKGGEEGLSPLLDAVIDGVIMLEEGRLKMVDKKRPSKLYPQVAECEERLNDFVQDIIDVGYEMLSTAGGKFYIPDMFFVGVLNRSINLIDAILVLISRWNFVAAGPLIRLHLDTLLRLSYLGNTETMIRLSYRFLRVNR